MSPKELKKLKQHLKSKKHNELGDADTKSYRNLIKQSIQLLELKSNQKVLEIGHKSGNHIAKFFEKSPHIEYHGLETSELLSKEAQKNNKKVNATFNLYDGNIIPYDENYFDRIIAIDTIHLWFDVQKILTEIKQTLKPKGICVLGFVQENLNEKQFFLDENFNLLIKKDLISLLQSVQLHVEQTIDTEFMIFKLVK